MTKKEKLLLCGALLLGFGIFMFFKSTRIWSFGFYRLGGQVSTGGILIALILLDLVLLVATGHKITKILLPVLIGMLLVRLLSDALGQGREIMSAFGLTALPTLSPFVYLLAALAVLCLIALACAVYLRTLGRKSPLALLQEKER